MTAAPLVATDYGAVGDGVTDDTAALRAWIAVAGVGSRQLYLPSGTYLVSSTLTIPDYGVELMGCGDRSVIVGTLAVTGNVLKVTGDRARVSRIKVVKTTATGGAAILVAANDVRLVEVTCTSGHVAVAFGDTSSARTPLRGSVENCVLTGADSVLTSRTGSDGVLKAHHRFINNQVIQMANRPGIESWTGATQIVGNRIISPSFSGGTAGITVGHKQHQQIAGNYIEGFSFGIEAGLTGFGIQISDNHVVSCGTGIAITSIGGVKEEAVVLDGNVVTLTSDYPGGAQTCIHVTGARTLTIAGGSLLYASDGNYTSPASRRGFGVEASNDVDRIHIDHVQFTNLEQGVRAGAVGGASGEITLSGSTFENVEYPINDRGGTAPVVVVTGGRFSNTYQSHHNFRATYQGVIFARAADHPAAHKGFAQFCEGPQTLATIRSCEFRNVLGTTMLADVDRAVPWNGYKQPAAEIRDVVVTSTPPVVAGCWSDGTAMRSLLNALVSLGLVTDATDA